MKGEKNPLSDTIASDPRHARRDGGACRREDEEAAPFGVPDRVDEGQGQGRGDNLFRQTKIGRGLLTTMKHVNTACSSHSDTRKEIEEKRRGGEKEQNSPNRQNCPFP